MKLSILICHLQKRDKFLQPLLENLIRQKNEMFLPQLVEILIGDHPTELIGYKRNKLLEQAKGEYVCFIDDDDRVSENYLRHLVEGINKGVDCCSLLGEITTDGKNPLLFEHSIKYKEYATNTQDKRIRYERYPNHLNAIRSSIAKQFKFPEKNHGEDTDWATQIFKSGLIKTEHYVPDILYYYDYRTKK